MQVPHDIYHSSKYILIFVILLLPISLIIMKYPWIQAEIVSSFANFLFLT